MNEKMPTILSDLLASHDVSQRKLARELEISYATIGRIVRGKGDPTLAVMEMIADYFGVTLDYLAGRE